MKLSALTLVVITTLLLLMVVTLSSLNFPLSWVFVATTIGQIFLVIMVYKVLRDDYSTDKTFDHLYEDKPILDNNR